MLFILGRSSNRRGVQGMRASGIVMKAGKAPRGHASVFPRKTLQEIVDHKKFINKPLFASTTLLHHTNGARKHHIGYISDAWLDKKGYLHVFGELNQDISTDEPLGLSMDSIIYDLTPIDFATAKGAGVHLRVDSLYVSGVTLVLKRVAAFECSTFHVFK